MEDSELKLKTRATLIQRGRDAIDIAYAAASQHDITTHTTIKYQLAAALAPAIFSELEKHADRQYEWDRRHESQG